MTAEPMRCPKCGVQLSAAIEGAGASERVIAACRQCGERASLGRPMRTHAGMRVPDWILLGLSVPAIGLLLLETALLPTYAKMYADFGEALPVMTQLVLGYWLPGIFAVVALALLVAGVALKMRQIPLGRWLLLAAMLVGAAGNIVFWDAQYLPIFTMANAIH